MYRSILKRLLFRLPAERAHQLTLTLLETALAIPGLEALLRRLYRVRDPQLQRTLMGLTFSNPVGLAAGFDKDGRHYRTMSVLGFGFIEVGTVTPRPQAGNPQPRLFRLPEDEALINRMGFNNEGVEALVERLRSDNRPPDLILGGNIGKNKDTPNESATDDYLQCFDTLFPYVDYFVVNVSSPNTPNLRALQDKEPLTELLTTLQNRNRAQTTPKPLLLKIAPDLTDSQLDDIIDIARTTELAGIIATNTTIRREPLHTDADQVSKIGAGGLSGRPLRERATEVIRYLRQHGGKDLVIIGVGGIASAEDAREKLQAGADLIQIYSGLVYEGPSLVRRINEGLL